MVFLPPPIRQKSEKPKTNAPGMARILQMPALETSWQGKELSSAVPDACGLGNAGSKSETKDLREKLATFSSSKELEFFYPQQADLLLAEEFAYVRFTDKKSRRYFSAIPLREYGGVLYLFSPMVAGMSMFEAGFLRPKPQGSGVYVAESFSKGVQQSTVELLAAYGIPAEKTLLRPRDL